MPYQDIGPYGYQTTVAAASATFTPQSDRAAVVNRILIDKPSATDTWVLKTGQTELARFDIRSTGNQQPLSGAYSGYPKTSDLFEAFQYMTPEQLIYPVPQGMTLKVSSVGGATADITMRYTEVRPEELSPGMMNHPMGNRVVTVLTGYVAASVIAAGEVAFDTQIGPDGVPNIFADGNIPAGWSVRVLKMFLEGGGRNTYNGAADHQSVTKYFACFRNTQRLYTREDLGGIPLEGQASAAGAANTVIGTDNTPMPPFQESDMFDFELLDPPLVLDNGANHRFRLGITGDVTGGADYSTIRQLFLCDIRHS